MRSNYKTYAFLVGLLIFVCISNAYATQTLFEADIPVVVIDPGHGGKDTGAGGQDAIQEKTVTLNAARLIAQQLEDGYRVVLTRSDDYGLNIADRTAVANHAKADIFLSLHTGSSFIRSIGGFAVYFYLPFHEPALSAEPKTLKPLADSNLPINWNQIQARYRMTSEKLANLIQLQLNSIRQQSDTKVQGAPLLVLKGADMPSVAIEIGNLSNPNEEKAMDDPEFLTLIAEAIVRGIDAYFAEKPK